MAETTAIGWCHHTRNWWEGCTKVSPGCDNCYAAVRDARFHRGEHWGAGAPRLPHHETAARDIRKWNRRAIEAGERRRVFINSLSDFFDNEVPDSWRALALAVMVECTGLDFLLLTKRIGNVAEMAPALWMHGAWPLNVWIGATMVNQAEVDRDRVKLRDLPAPVRFVSYEPALGPVDWREALRESVDWLIVGGESGPGARSMDLEWARAAVAQCDAAAVPVFVKQLGAYPVDYTRPSTFSIGDGGTGAPVHMTRDRAGADPTEWPSDLRVQQFPNIRQGDL